MRHQPRIGTAFLDDLDYATINNTVSSFLDLNDGGSSPLCKADCHGHKLIDLYRLQLRGLAAAVQRSSRQLWLHPNCEILPERADDLHYIR